MSITSENAQARRNREVKVFSPRRMTPPQSVNPREVAKNNPKADRTNKALQAR
jgi:hypothetical protein